MHMDRRDFLKLLGIGGAVFVLGPRSGAGAAEMATSKDDFLYSHEGMSGTIIAE